LDKFSPKNVFYVISCQNWFLKSAAEVQEAKAEVSPEVSKDGRSGEQSVDAGQPETAPEVQPDVVQAGEAKSELPANGQLPPEVTKPESPEAALEVSLKSLCTRFFVSRPIESSLSRASGQQKSFFLWPIPSRGRCYDHNFKRFSTIFAEKIGVFLTNQCYDQNFA
jgi:hypothetical protein